MDISDNTEVADNRITISRRFENVSPAMMPKKPNKKCAERS